MENPKNLNFVLVAILIVLILFLSGAAVYLGGLPKKDNSTNTPAGTDEQRELSLNSSKTPVPTFEKGEEIVSEGTLLKYPADHQSYPDGLYIKKEDGLEHVIDITELVKNSDFNLKDDYLNKKVRVTGYLVPVTPQSGSSYPFEVRLKVEKIEIL